MGLFLASGALQMVESLASLFHATGIGEPVRGLMHEEVKHDSVDDGQSADQVAEAPVGVHGGRGTISVEVGDLVGEAAENRACGVADRVADNASENPASNHARHADRHEDAALLGRNRLREHGGDDGDAGADAETGDQAECCEEHEVIRESLGQGEQTIEDNSDGQHLFTADLVGQDAADCAAENHAEQAPRGERAHESTRVRVVGPERMCNEQVGGVNDHEVVTIENHSEDHEEEHKPRVAVNSQMVYNL